MEYLCLLGLYLLNSVQAGLNFGNGCLKWVGIKNNVSDLDSVGTTNLIYTSSPMFFKDSDRGALQKREEMHRFKW